MEAINRYLFAVIILLCTSNYGWTQNEIYRDSILAGYTPQIMQYDTIDGVFLYEDYIDAYIIGEDAITKGNDFLRGGVINHQLYQQGVFTYFTSVFRYQRMNDKNQNVHFDTTSIFNVLREIRHIGIQNGTLWSETDINPFCGAYYKKYHMRIEVLYLGDVIQKMPLLMNCEEVEEYMRVHDGRNYKMVALPTYLITKIFECQKIRR